VSVVGTTCARRRRSQRRACRRRHRDNDLVDAPRFQHVRQRLGVAEHRQAHHLLSNLHGVIVEEPENVHLQLRIAPNLARHHGSRLARPDDQHSTDIAHGSTRRGLPPRFRDDAYGEPKTADSRERQQPVGQQHGSRKPFGGVKQHGGNEEDREHDRRRRRGQRDCQQIADARVPPITVVKPERQKDWGFYQERRYDIPAVERTDIVVPDEQEVEPKTECEKDAQRDER
jgi:hypothetical protein